MQCAAERLAEVALRIFMAAGSARAEAAKVAQRLVDANLTGHDSHGVIRIPQYVDMVQTGALLPNQAVKLLAETDAVSLLDGQYGYGQIVGEQAVDAAIAKARQHGIGMASLRHAGHLGRIGDWAEHAAAAGMTSLHFVNVVGIPARVVPHGGLDPRGTTNPIAIGMPTPAGPPVILDFATSAVAEGKVRLARNKGTFLPHDCLIGADGQPTTDPATLYADPPARMLPLGGAVSGHKGGALWLMCDLLAGAFAGGCTRPPEDPLRQGSNMLSIVIAPACFAEPDGIGAEIQRYVDFVRSARPRDPEKPVMVPGEPEQRGRTERLAKGVTVDPETWSQIMAAATRVGLASEPLEQLVH